jgi:hypothetical protein
MRTVIGISLRPVEPPPFLELTEHCPFGIVCLPNDRTELGMDDSTKREIWVLTLSTLAAVPVVTTVAMVVVSGIVAW